MFVYVDEFYWTAILFSLDIALEVRLCLLIIVKDISISIINLLS
jgi:hypothetical protein